MQKQYKTKTFLATALFFSLAFLPLAQSKAIAQGINFSVKSSDSIEVSASDGIELHQKEKKVMAIKNAKAVRGESVLTSDLIEGYYRENPAGSTEIWRLFAKGNVIMTAPKNKATGAEAEYSIDTDTLTLRGAPAHLYSETDHVTAERLEYLQSKKLVIAKGKAKLTQDKGIITSDQISALFKENKEGKLEVNLMNAEGNVVISTDTETATGNKASYNPKTGVAVLLGDVKIIKDTNYLTGAKATVNLKTGISKLFAGKTATGENGRVKGVFLPNPKKDSKLPTK